MSSDPILDGLYAAKQFLTETCGNDLHALAESFRRSPAWTPVARPARPIRTAQARLRILTDPGDAIREVRKIRETLLEKTGGDLRKHSQRDESATERGKKTAPATLASRKKNAPRGSFRSSKNKTPKG